MKIADYSTLLNTINTGRQPMLIGIDGKSCSGKSSLAEALANDTGASLLCLDDFFIPFADQSQNVTPAFPFPYFRYEEFIGCARLLRNGKACRFFPYDWQTDKLSDEPKRVDPTELVIVEGLSALSAQMADLFDLKIFVVSDPSTQFEAILARNGRKLEDQWVKLWLPSERIYLQSKPWELADFLFVGRGAQADILPSYLVY